MIITSLKLPREIFRVPSLWPQVFTLNNYDEAADRRTSFLVAIRNSLIVAVDRDHHLGAHLVVRRLLDGALPLPLPRRHRPADPLRLPDAGLAALHPALDRDGAAASSATRCSG